MQVVLNGAGEPYEGFIEDLRILHNPEISHLTHHCHAPPSLPADANAPPRARRTGALSQGETSVRAKTHGNPRNSLNHGAPPAPQTPLARLPGPEYRTFFSNTSHTKSPKS